MLDSNFINRLPQHISHEVELVFTSRLPLHTFVPPALVAPSTIEDLRHFQLCIVVDCRLRSLGASSFPLLIKSIRLQGGYSEFQGLCNTMVREVDKEIRAYLISNE